MGLRPRRPLPHRRRHLRAPIPTTTSSTPPDPTGNGRVGAEPATITHPTRPRRRPGDDRLAPPTAPPHHALAGDDLKAEPDTDAGSDFRVRHDRVDKAGKVALRHHGTLFHIGIGRALAGTPLILLIHDLDIRVIHAATGEIIRAFTLDPEQQYQPTGNKRGGPSRPYGPYRPRKRKQPEP